MEKIECFTVNRKKMILPLLTAYTLAIGFMFYLVVLKYPFWLFVLTVVLYVSFPLIFRRQLFKPFMNDALLTFTNESITFEKFDRHTGDPELVETTNYADILWFSSSDYPVSSISRFKLKLKNNEKRNYDFIFQDYQSDKLISKQLFKYFNEYNDLKENRSVRIAYQPNFLGTRAGKIYFVLITVFLIGIIAIPLYLRLSIRPGVYSAIAMYIIILQMWVLNKQNSKELHY